MLHPDIERTMLTGYPSHDYLTFETLAEADHPIEDIYGDEIQKGDSYLIDEAGRVVLKDNLNEYLSDQCGAVFYKAK